MPSYLLWYLFSVYFKSVFVNWPFKYFFLNFNLKKKYFLKCVITCDKVRYLYIKNLIYSHLAFVFDCTISSWSSLPTHTNYWIPKNRFIRRFSRIFYLQIWIICFEKDKITCEKARNSSTQHKILALNTYRLFHANQKLKYTFHFYF